MKGRAARGQAAVEASLGILLFVSVLLLGLRFAEIGVAGMKLTETASFALFRVTGEAAHELPASFAPVAARAALAGAQDASGRYADLDGRSHVTEPSFVAVTTRATPPRVSCNTGGATPPMAFTAVPPVSGVLRDNGGLRCTAESDLLGFFVPRVFAQGPFQADLLEGVVQSVGLKTCAVGRPRGINGPCDGAFSLMLDDWGLTDTRTEELPCPASLPGASCPNAAYHTTARLVYALSGPLTEPQAAALVSGVSGAPAPDGVVSVGAFHMSYVGEEDGFVQTLDPTWLADGYHPRWATTPFERSSQPHRQSYDVRTDCFLGLDCDTSSLRAP